MGFHQRLLHKIRGTEPYPKSPIQLGFGQQMQVVPIQLQNASQPIGLDILRVMAQEVLDAFRHAAPARPHCSRLLSCADVTPGSKVLLDAWDESHVPGGILSPSGETNPGIFCVTFVGAGRLQS
jgi:hypothetical protein